MKGSNYQLKFFIIGFFIGILIALIGGVCLYKVAKGHNHLKLRQIVSRIKKIHVKFNFMPFQKYTPWVEDFSKSITVKNGKSFGKYGQLTFELYHGGTFLIDGQSNFSWQKSDHYGDVAIIRSTRALPKTYKIRVVVGDIDYDLDKIAGLPKDPQYPEGPQNENGCYLVAITDEEPSGHHTNIWWHQHRKVVIDVDNNVWGHGMPHPIFMVYFNENNKLVAFDGETKRWQSEWKKAATYNPQSWYRAEIEKTNRQFILRIYDEKDNLVREARVDLKNIWNEDENHKDYFVVGDPHENYYQGSMKLKSIAMTMAK